ncbi:MAG TPA: hypothetical protein VHP38_10060 [Ruminiclostridium sp.]|nr:hypothetical protein [Ruminiclostridium sp.]
MEKRLLKVRNPNRIAFNLNRLVAKRSRRIVTAVLLLTIVVSTLCLLIFGHKAGTYDYTVTPLQDGDNAIQVTVNIKNAGKNTELKLYKSGIDFYDAGCLNADTNGKVAFKEKGDFIIIDPGKHDNLKFSYKAKLGKLDKHGHTGGAYGDMLAFDGEEAFILPEYAFSTGDNEIKKHVAGISVHYNVPKDWASVIPFSKTADNQKYSQLSKPTWADIYDFTKSCFAFGKFKQYTYPQGSGTLQVLVDPASGLAYTKEVEEGLRSIYKYYSDLFGSTINFSILILRKDLKDNSYIIGGASTQTCGSTFDPDVARDWQLMGHRFFHAFFDTSVREATFHSPPQLWFYEGMATYYENMSMDNLPESIRRKTGLASNNGFLTLFKQYLYMRLKDKNLYSVAPMNEEKVSGYRGITEFLHYTEAPLVIKAIDDIGYSEYGQHDRLLNYIFSNRGKKDLSLDELIRYAIGNQAQSFSDSYLYSNALLPLWYLGQNADDDPGETMQSLKDIEYTQWTWFRLEDPEYPLDNISDKGLSQLNAQAEKKIGAFCRRKSGTKYPEAFTHTLFIAETILSPGRHMRS